MKKSPTPFGNTVASYGTKVCNAVYLAGALTAAVFSESCEGGVLGIEEGHDIKKDTITVIDYVPVPVIPTIVMNQPNDSTACFVADYPDPLLDANLGCVSIPPSSANPDTVYIEVPITEHDTIYVGDTIQINDTLYLPTSCPISLDRQTFNYYPSQHKRWGGLNITNNGTCGDMPVTIKLEGSNGTVDPFINPASASGRTIDRQPHVATGTTTLPEGATTHITMNALDLCPGEILNIIITIGNNTFTLPFAILP